MTYFDEMRRAMAMLAENPTSVFLGQAVGYPGTGMSKTFEGIAPDRLLEMPVAEDLQMGMAIGMALAGRLPVCVYPRWSFLLLATSQLVLHLDKLPIYSAGGFRPRVIVRTAIPTPVPLDPGAQHLGDFSDAYRSMLLTVRVVVLDRAEQIVPEYRAAADRDGSTILVERTELYA